MIEGIEDYSSYAMLLLKIAALSPRDAPRLGSRTLIAIWIMALNSQ